MEIKRKLTEQVISAATQFPVVAIVGPRQSGKTTLAQAIFREHRYVSLEDFDVRELATTDPRGFLNDYPSQTGIILDEIQHVPKLLSYIQTIVDREKKKGFFILTGSQNFLVNEAITQTLAGRIAIFTLLPLSLAELEQASFLPNSIESLIFAGSFPQMYAEKIQASRLYGNYIHTYVERDVRQIKNVQDLNLFQTFLRLCAGRIGQIVNLSSLGNDCGIDHSTVQSWLSLLEASYIIFRLYPYYKNFGRRLVKSPKIYFVDTGIACWLLNIKSEEDLLQHYLRGGLVESFIITDLLKQKYNLDQQPNLYFWRDQIGNEIDCIIDEYPHPIPVEIKSGKTVSSWFFKELLAWQTTTNAPEGNPCYLVYGGEETQNWPQAKVLGWKSAAHLIK